MALFQRKEQATTESLYTLGLNKNLLIVGLGNPGKQYENSRHSIGFVCVDAFAEAHEFGGWTEKKDLNCLVASKEFGGSRVILCKPTTFMNLSGEAVQKLAHFYKLQADQIVVIHDELDIPFGQIRIRSGGSDAGHNGIKSLIQYIGGGFGRVRVGIDGGRPEGMESADFVLAKFAKEEQAQIPTLTKETTSILTEYVYRGDLLAETRQFIV